MLLRWTLIKDGAVRDVTILSGPPIFHEAVKTAMILETSVDRSSLLIRT